MSQTDVSPEGRFSEMSSFQDNPNRHAISGLVAAACWLSQRPELPEVHVTVHVGRYNLSRAELEQVAALFDKDLTDLEERVGDLTTVLSATLNPRVQMQASGWRADLEGNVGRENLILQRCPQCAGTKVTVDRWGEEMEPCEWCAGRGFVVPEPVPVTTRDFVTPETGVRVASAAEYSKSDIGPASWDEAA